MKVYIAGPITGVEGYEENFKRAEAVLEAHGYEPVNPAAEGEVAGADYRFYINRSLRQLMECDAICFLPGWELSKGVALEFKYCETVPGVKPFIMTSDYKNILTPEGLI